MSDWLDGGGGGSPVDVRAVLDCDALGLLWDLVQLGALVSFGTTSDGGSLGVTVTVDGRWRRIYVRDADALGSELSEAVPSVTAALGVSASNGKRDTRRRGARAR